MTCEAVRERLLELPLDTFEAELGGHLAACPECRRVADVIRQDEGALRVALDAWAERPVDDLVQAALSATPRHKRFDMFQGIGALALAAAAAATLLLGLRVEDGGAPEVPEFSTSSADATLVAAQKLVEETDAIGWGDLSEQDWFMRAYELQRTHAEVLARPASPERTEVEFRVLAAMGRSAENANNPSPPFYANVGGVPVNASWYLAAKLSSDHPELISLVDQEVKASIEFYQFKMESGELKRQDLTIVPL